MSLKLREQHLFRGVPLIKIAQSLRVTSLVVEMENVDHGVVRTLQNRVRSANKKLGVDIDGKLGAANRIADFLDGNAVELSVLEPVICGKLRTFPDGGAGGCDFRQRNQIGGGNIIGMHGGSGIFDAAEPVAQGFGAFCFREGILITGSLLGNLLVYGTVADFSDHESLEIEKLFCGCPGICGVRIAASLPDKRRLEKIHFC